MAIKKTKKKTPLFLEKVSCSKNTPKVISLSPGCKLRENKNVIKICKGEKIKMLLPDKWAPNRILPQQNSEENGETVNMKEKGEGS